MEQSVYIVKPEGMLHRSAIRQMILSTGLSVVGFYTVAMPRWVPKVLYPELSEERGELWEITSQHLINQQCEIGMVEGEGAIEKLVVVCGTETDPAQCGSETIRGFFGRTTPVELGNGKMYWFNVIHRPKNVEEVNRDMSIALVLHSTGS